MSVSASTFDSWLAGPLQPLVRDLVESGADRLAPLLDPGAVRKMVRAFYAGESERVAQIWSLLSLRLWLDTSRAPVRLPAGETAA